MIENREKPSLPTIQQGFNMTTTFDCVQDWYDDGILQPVPDGDNYSARLRVAEDVIDDACSEDIEEFDCHDLISIVSDHYSVSIEDLLSYYDTKY